MSNYLILNFVFFLNMSVPFTYLPLSLTLTGHMNNDTIYFNFYSYQISSTVPGGPPFSFMGYIKVCSIDLYLKTSQFYLSVAGFHLNPLMVRKQL